MSSESSRPAPDLWTFAPLGAALFIIGAYVLIYSAFIMCSPLLGAGCKPVSVGPLLLELEKREAHAPLSEACAVSVGVKTIPTPEAAPTPAPAPTPQVTIKTEGGGATPLVSVQVALPPASASAPSATPTEAQRAAKFYGARVLWMLLYAVGVITALVASALSAHVVWRSLRGEFDDARRLAAVAAVFVVSFILTWLLWLLSKGNAPVVEPLMQCLASADIASAFPIVKFGNHLGLFVAFVLLLASCAVLWPVRKAPRKAVGVLAERLRLLRALLYVGMVALVIAVLRLDATFKWALSALPEEAEGFRLVKGITSSVVSGEAAAYTLLLAAIYVPAALVLRRRGRALITPERGYTQEMGDEWLEAQGLNVAGSAKSLLPKLAAILAPVVVGSAGELFKGVGSLF